MYRLPAAHVALIRDPRVFVGPWYVVRMACMVIYSNWLQVTGLLRGFKLTGQSYQGQRDTAFLAIAGRCIPAPGFPVLGGADGMLGLGHGVFSSVGYVTELLVLLWGLLCQ